MNMGDRSPVSRIHDARRLLLSGHAGEAMEALSATGAEGFATYHLVRAECFYALHQFADAKREAQKAIELAPHAVRAEILLELAQEMMELDRMVRPSFQLPGVEKGEAGPAFAKNLGSSITPHRASLDDTAEEAAEYEPGLVSETLAEIMVHQSRFEEARKIYIQLSRMSPERDEYFHERIAEMEAAIGGLASKTAW